MDTRLAFQAVFEVVEGGWVHGRLVELPGVITAAPSLDQAKEMLADALAEYLRSFIVPSLDEAVTSAGATGAVNVVISAA